MSKAQARTETDIEVKVANFDEIEDELNNSDEFLEQVEEKVSDERGVEEVELRLNNHGWIEADGDGIYVIDTDAIVLEEPITNDNTLDAEIYPVHDIEEKEDGTTSKSYGMFPVGTFPISEDQIRELEVEETQNLKEFVRSFSNRIERNYEKAVDYLEDKVK